MRIVDQIYSWLSGGAGVNLVSLLIGATGVILAFFFYFRSKRIRLPVFRVRTFVLIEDKLSKIQALKILYGDQPVEKLSLTKVAIWNRGSEPIRHTDIAETDKLRIQIDEKEKLLGSQISLASSPTNNFSIRADNEVGVVNIAFEYFQKGEGLIVDIYHTGDRETKVQPKGTVIGGEHLMFFNQKDFLSDAFARFTFGWANRTIPNIKNQFFQILFIIVMVLPVFFALMPVFIPLLAIDKIAAFFRRAPKHFLLE